MAVYERESGGYSEGHDDGQTRTGLAYTVLIVCAIGIIVAAVVAIWAAPTGQRGGITRLVSSPFSRSLGRGSAPFSPSISWRATLKRRQRARAASRSRPRGLPALQKPQHLSAKK